MSRRSGKQRYYEWPKCNTPHPLPPLKLDILYWLTAGTATRLCMMDGNWADPDVLECKSQRFLLLLSEVTSKQPCIYICSGHWNMVDTNIHLLSHSGTLSPNSAQYHPMVASRMKDLDKFIIGNVEA